MATRQQKREPLGERPEDTRAALLAAARAEFGERGFAGTDSNKIARRAGFAPQTFYRWYRDKTEIFIAAYRAWEEEERAALAGLVARRAASNAMAQAIVLHHRTHLLFRRSLRLLAVTDPGVRRARAESRARQAEHIRIWSRRPKLKATELYVTLLEVERLADAVAEGELADLGVTDETGISAIERLIKQLRHGSA